MVGVQRPAAVDDVFAGADAPVGIVAASKVPRLVWDNGMVVVAHATLEMTVVFQVALRCSLDVESVWLLSSAGHPPLSIRSLLDLDRRNLGVVGGV